MRYLCVYRPARQEGQPPTQDEMVRMGQLIDEMTKKGTLVRTAGLKPSKEGVRVRSNYGKLSMTEGPFTETKEVIGGFAVLEAPSMKEAIELTRLRPDVVDLAHLVGEQVDLALAIASGPGQLFDPGAERRHGADPFAVGLERPQMCRSRVPIEELRLGVGPQQPLGVVLPVDLHELRTDLREGADRGELARDPDRALPPGADRSRQHQPFVVAPRPWVVEPRRRHRRCRRGRDVEPRPDRGGAGAGTH